MISKAVRVALAGGALLCLTLQARAADEAAAGDAGEASQTNALQEITVLGQRTTTEIAREAQLQAPNLIDITTADEMLRLPDVNTGEAVRRIPGISLETDTGEGRYINIRGMDADLNSTTFGGLRLPPTNNSSPSGAGRAVAFDSIPVGFVGAITVTKTNLPEQDAEAIGGTIDITPKTAPLDGKPSLDLKLGTGFELLRHTWVTDGAVTASTRFGGSGDYQPFSILGTAALYTDRRGIDDAEAGFTDKQDQGVPDKAFNGFEQRYYRYHRKRHGYGVDFGFEIGGRNILAGNTLDYHVGYTSGSLEALRSQLRLRQRHCRERHLRQYDTAELAEVCRNRRQPLRSRRLYARPTRQPDPGTEQPDAALLRPRGGNRCEPADTHRAHPCPGGEYQGGCQCETAQPRG